MADEVRLPRKLSEEPEASKPVRPSHQQIIDRSSAGPTARGSAAAIADLDDGESELV
ncbi:hypothetical protein ABIA43_004823 [Bradyrhizobium sp. USDA 328]|jgi:hypothetical protein